MGGGGNLSTEGYVEVFDVTNGQWGGICDNNFDIIDAHVVCKMLGFPTAIVAFVDGAAADLYGTAQSGSNFGLDNLGCKGWESSIFHCPSDEDESTGVLIDAGLFQVPSNNTHAGPFARGSYSLKNEKKNLVSTLINDTCNINSNPKPEVHILYILFLLGRRFSRSSHCSKLKKVLNEIVTL